MSPDSQPAAAEIDAIVAAAGGWRGDALARLRRVVLSADEGIVEEIKWRKPSKPEGDTLAQALPTESRRSRR